MGTHSSAKEITERKNTILHLGKYIRLLSQWLNWIAGIGLIGMLALIVADIIGIKALASPVPGGIEIVAFLGVVVTGFAIAWTQIKKGHIQVDFIIMHLPHRTQEAISAVVSLLGFSFFILLAWRSWDYGLILQSSGEVSMTKRIPFYPFVWGLAFCYLVTGLVLVSDFCTSLMKVGKKWIR